MNLKKHLRFAALLLSFGTSGIMSSYAQRQPDCPCRIGEINIGTGINPVTGTTLAGGAYDPVWIVTQSPDPAIATPATPYVISSSNVPSWGNTTSTRRAAMLTGANYISPFNTQSYTVNNPAPNPAFVLALKFCVCTDADPNQAVPYNISGLLNADDRADVYLDGFFVTSSTNWNTVDSFSVNQMLGIGQHTLEIRLRNTGGQAMGVALAGKIKCTNGNNTLVGYSCCNNTGAIGGHKYLDKNCNGKIDVAGDSAAPGWTFQLSPGGQQVTTDALGFFSFPSLAPGTYTLTEVAQAGWNPVSPAGGTATVTVVAGQVTTIDFLNSNCAKASCDDECYWRITGNSSIDSKLNYLGTNVEMDLVMKTNGVERARIEGTGNGNMGISTPAPTTTLHVLALPKGAPSGVRLEELPLGSGQVLVADDQGYIFRSRMFQERKAGDVSEMETLQQELNALKSEVSELKSMLRGDNANTLKVSPNPTDGQVNATFHIAGDYTSAAIQVVDMTGKAITSQPVSGSDGTVHFTIPLSTTSGNLLCRLVVDSKQVATQKLALLNK